MRMLENEGFRHDGYVDIFDGGPTMVARTNNVTSVQNACECTVTAMQVEEGERAILATGRLGSFRACFGGDVGGRTIRQFSNRLETHRTRRTVSGCHRLLERRAGHTYQRLVFLHFG
jgi:arginine/ornithine N-succinyltransferase beta subunit